MCSYLCWGRNCLPPLVTLPVQHKTVLVFFATRPRGWLMVNFLSTGTPRSLSRMLLFSWSALSIYWCARWFLPMCRIWHLPLLNCLRFLSAHFFSLLRSLLMAAQPCNIQPLFPVLCPQQTSWGYSAPSSMKTLNRTGASTGTWSTPEVTGL